MVIDPKSRSDARSIPAKGVFGKDFPLPPRKRSLPAPSIEEFEADFTDYLRRLATADKPEAD